MGRKQAREGAMKVLFQMDSMGDYTEESLDMFLTNFEYDEMETLYIKESISKIKENLEVIDNHIKANFEGWSIYRLAKVDLAVLRIAIYEILYRKDIPIEVSINEAIETVKKYSTEESFKFVNGVLGGFVRSINNKETI